MKKIFTILGIAAVASVANAQTNLVPNPGFESWDTTTTPPKPTGWSFISPTGITQETVMVHSGTSSVKAVAPATGNGSLNVDIPATASTQYTLGYWILDNDPNARARHWVQARTASANITWTGTTFQPTTYSTDNPSWVYVSATSTTPAGTELLRFDFRNYGTGTGGGTVYYDDVVLVQGTLAAGEVTPSKHRLIKNSIVTSDLVFATNSSVKIFDVTGKLIKTADVQDNTKLNLSNLPKGTYIVKGLANGESTMQKFIKQ